MIVGDTILAIGIAAGFICLFVVTLCVIGIGASLANIAAALRAQNEHFKIGAAEDDDERA